MIKLGGTTSISSLCRVNCFFYFKGGINMDLFKVFKEKKIGDKVKVEGWIRNNRSQKNFGFIDFYDGTTFESLQIIYDDNMDNFSDLTHLHVGASIESTGILTESNGKQKMEMHAENITLLADCDEDYPIQPKRHTMEFLRTQAHLRARTKTFQAVFKIRSLAAKAIHDYFQNNINYNPSDCCNLNN